MPPHERPTSRLERCGSAALSDTELLAILLQGGFASSDQALDVASRLLVHAGSLQALLSYQPAQFRAIPGIGAGKAATIAAALEIARRALCPYRDAQPLLNRADLVFDYLRPEIIGLNVEKFYVLSLNRKNRLIRSTAITSGTATAALAHPREVFRQVIIDSGTAVIVAHNHPSGDPAPSAPDVQVTRQLREAAQAVDIELLDHVIIGTPSADPLGRGYFSFREAGML